MKLKNLTLITFPLKDHRTKFLKFKASQENFISKIFNPSVDKDEDKEELSFFPKLPSSKFSETIQALDEIGSYKYDYLRTNVWYMSNAFMQLKGKLISANYIPTKIDANNIKENFQILKSISQDIKKYQTILDIDNNRNYLTGEIQAKIYGYIAAVQYLFGRNYTLAVELMNASKDPKIKFEIKNTIQQEAACNGDLDKEINNKIIYYYQQSLKYREQSLRLWEKENEKLINDEDKSKSSKILTEILYAQRAILTVHNEIVRLSEDNSKITQIKENAEQRLFNIIQQYQMYMVYSVADGIKNWKDILPKFITDSGNFIWLAIFSLSALLTKDKLQEFGVATTEGSNVKNLLGELTKALKPFPFVEKSYNFFTKYALNSFYNFALFTTIIGLTAIMSKIMLSLLLEPILRFISDKKKVSWTLAILKSDNKILNVLFSDYLIKKSPENYLQTALTLFQYARGKTNEKEQIFYLKSSYKLLTKLIHFITEHPNSIEPSILKIATIHKEYIEKEFKRLKLN